MIHINHVYKWACLKIFNLIQTFTHPVFGGVVGVVVSRLTRATFRNNVHGKSSAVRRRCIFWIWASNIFWSFWVWYWPIMVIYENIIDSILNIGWIDNHWWSLIIYFLVKNYSTGHGHCANQHSAFSHWSSCRIHPRKRRTSPSGGHQWPPQHPSGLPLKHWSCADHLQLAICCGLRNHKYIHIFRSSLAIC